MHQIGFSELPPLPTTKAAKYLGVNERTLLLIGKQNGNRSVTTLGTHCRWDVAGFIAERRHLAKCGHGHPGSA